MSAADHCGYKEERIEAARELIGLDQEKFITEQIRAVFYIFAFLLFYSFKFLYFKLIKSQNSNLNK